MLFIWICSIVIVFLCCFIISYTYLHISYIHTVPIYW